jgi:hypothetical protein
MTEPDATDPVIPRDPTSFRERLLALWTEAQEIVLDDRDFPAWDGATKDLLLGLGLAWDPKADEYRFTKPDIVCGLCVETGGAHDDDCPAGAEGEVTFTKRVRREANLAQDSFLAQDSSAKSDFTPCTHPYANCVVCHGTGQYLGDPCSSCVMRKWYADGVETGALRTLEEIEANRRGSGEDVGAAYKRGHEEGRVAAATAFTAEVMDAHADTAKLRVSRDEWKQRCLTLLDLRVAQAQTADPVKTCKHCGCTTYGHRQLCCEAIVAERRSESASSDMAEQIDEVTAAGYADQARDQRAASPADFTDYAAQARADANAFLAEIAKLRKKDAIRVREYVTLATLLRKAHAAGRRSQPSVILPGTVNVATGEVHIPVSNLGEAITKLGEDMIAAAKSRDYECEAGVLAKKLTPEKVVELLKQGGEIRKDIEAQYRRVAQEPPETAKAQPAEAKLFVFDAALHAARATLTFDDAERFAVRLADVLEITYVGPSKMDEEREVECVDCGCALYDGEDMKEPRCDTDRDHHARECGEDCPVICPSCQEHHFPPSGKDCPSLLEGVAECPDWPGHPHDWYVTTGRCTRCPAQRLFSDPLAQRPCPRCGEHSGQQRMLSGTGACFDSFECVRRQRATRRAGGSE